MSQINRYSNFEFEPYQFQEFPKAVKHNDKNYVVSSAEEEAALKATVRDYRKEAMQRAEELKLEIPEGWEVDKIQALIKKTESDIEFAKFMEPEVPKTNKLTLAKKPE
jgi:hypothetical protein